jgi:hypothetical protein
VARVYFQHDVARVAGCAGVVEVVYWACELFAGFVVAAFFVVDEDVPAAHSGLCSGAHFVCLFSFIRLVLAWGFVRWVIAFFCGGLGFVGRGVLCCGGEQ